MAGAEAPFVREEGDSVVVDWDTVEVLLPETYFSDPPLAEDMGGVVETLAFFDVRAIEREGSKPRTFAFRLPAKLRLRYAEARSETDADGEPVRVFVARRGEVLIDDVNIVQSSDNVSALFRVMAGARISGVSYTDMANLFIEGAKLNGSSPGVTRMVLEAMTSEMARWTKDQSVPLRVPLAAGKAGDTDFRFVKLKELPRLNSVFTGLGFEDVQLAVQSGVRKTMAGEPQRESPMEGIVRL